MLNLGSEPSSSVANQSTAFLPEGELLNLSSETSSNSVSGSRGLGGNGDLLQDLFQSSHDTPPTTTTFVGAPSSIPANPFFTLDPFDPLVAPTPSVATPASNLSSSNSFGNFAKLQQSQPPDESLMGNWDSILKQPQNVGTRPMTLPTLTRNSSTPNLEAKAKDPLADFGNLMGLAGATNTATRPPAWGSANTKTPITIGIF